MLDIGVDRPGPVDVAFVFIPRQGVQVPFIEDLVAPDRVHAVEHSGIDAVGKLAVMGLEDGALIAQKIVGEADPGRQAVGVEDGPAHSLDRSPVLGEAQAEIDVQAVGDLPGVLGEGFEADHAGIDVVAVIFVGQVVAGIPAAPVIVVVHVVLAGIAVCVLGD